MFIAMQRFTNFAAFFIFLSCFGQGWPQAVRALLEGPHINTLNILLPPKTTYPVQYRLQGSGGCFTWSWDHHDIIQVTEEYNGTEGCSDSAVVTSVAPYDGRRATAIYATDSVTGQVIRCEVFIDNISRVRIFHHSLKLDLDGLATLRIRAFDAEDNVFSSLVGMRFLWRLLPSSSFSGVSSHSLAHLSLKNSPLSDCGCICGDIDTQIELEEKGLGSDLYVVRGISVGQERISVTVLEPQLEKLGDEILLTIAEAISLEPPSPLYILVGTQVQFTLKTLRYKMPSTIQLPSPYHRWSVTNSSVAEVDPFMGTVSAQSIGSTYVLVEDIRVTSHQQISSVHVVIPVSLLLYLTPLQFKDARQKVLKKGTSIVSSDVPWYIVVGWDYVLQVMAFSLESSSRPLYLTKDNDLRFFFEEWPYWKAIPIPEDVAHEQAWQNGTLIKPVSEGTGKLVASLKYSKSLMYENLTEVLLVEQEVIVCNPVLILFENELRGHVLNLPWNPKDSQDYQLEAHGGCGKKLSDYRWTSSDVAVATVSSLGVVHVKGLGQALIRVTTVTNPMNTDEVVVEVSAPSSIACLGGLPVEVEVGSHLLAAITLKSPEGFYYSKCQSFSPLILWRIVGQEISFLQVNDTRNSDSFGSPHHLMAPSWSTVPSACAWTSFLAVQPGRATVTATLSFDDLSKVPNPGASGKDLVVSWTISGYAPLTIVQAGHGKCCGGYDCGMNQLEPFMVGPGSSQCHLSVLLLVPGSSMKVMLQGGPEHWGQGVEFIERYDVISNSEENEAEYLHVSHLVSNGGRFYEIACAALGNYTLIFYRGNSIGEDHPTPVVAAVNLSVVCSLPSLITLLVDETGNALPHIKASAQADRHHNRVHKAPITVQNSRTLRLAAVGLDGNGKPFANVSSLPLNWVLRDCTGLMYWEGPDTLLTYIENGLWEQKLVLRDASGQCLVRASVEMLTENNWFLPEIQLAIQEVLKQRAHVLTDAVQLQLVTSVRIEPRFHLLYHHLDAKACFAVLGGSGHMEAHSNDSKVVVVVLEQPPVPHHVHLTIAARGLGMASIAVRDVGLIIPASDTALVRVAEVAWVRLLLPEESSIEVSTFLTVNLQAGDNMGNTFDSSQFEFMDIRVHVRDEVLELVPNANVQKATGNKVLGSTFMIRGANLGVTDLYVSVWPNVGHEILSEFHKVEVYAPLSIQPEDLVLAPGARYVVWVHGGPSIGVVIHFSSYNDTIASIESQSGMVVANSPGVVTIYAYAYAHGETIVCEAAVEVKVHIPVSVLLNVRGGQLAIGRAVSIFPIGTQEDLFSFFELCTDYKWTVGDEQVLTLRSTEEIKGHSYSGNFQNGNKKHAVSSTTGAVGESRPVDPRFSVVAVGMTAGKTDITVAFSCHFHSKNGYYNSHFYTASDTVRVIPDPPLALGIPATWLLPPNFKTSSLLPQLSDSIVDNAPPGKRSIMYSLLQESCKESGSISLEGAHIKTTERNDLTCIQARDRRTGRSEVAACIKVAEVFQMMIGDPISSFHVVVISVGASQLHSVTVQDNTGAPFFEVGNAVKLTAQTNRVDLVSVRVLREDDDDYIMNATVLLQGLRPGTALIRVSQLGMPNIADYILVHVGVHVSPSKPFLHAGGHVNFSILGMGPSSREKGHWSSSDAGVIQINQYTGEAIGVGAGSASVNYNTSYLVASTTATVVQVSSVAVIAPEGQLTNVHSPVKGYQFPVRVSDPQSQDLEVFAKDQKLSFKCHSDPPHLGHCSAWHDPDSEKAYCIFQPHPPERLFLSLQGQQADLNFKAGDSKGCLIIKIIAEVPGIREVGSVLTTFAGGFTILDLPEELHFKPTRNSTRLTVVGSAGGLEVSWTRKDALKVKRISSDRDAYGVGGHAIFEVAVNNYQQSFVSKLIFFLPTTGQREVIKIEYDVKNQGKGALPQQIITAAIITLVLGVFPLIICACLLDLPRPFRVQQDGRVNYVETEPPGERPSSETPVRTPSQGLQGFETPSPVSSSRSPPRPYTDYVSKTIENTPYFRRGVRQFDPSRTY